MLDVAPQPVVRRLRSIAMASMREPRPASSVPRAQNARAIAASQNRVATIREILLQAIDLEMETGGLDPSATEPECLSLEDRQTLVESLAWDYLSELRGWREKVVSGTVVGGLLKSR